MPSAGYKPKSNSGYSDALMRASNKGSGMGGTLGASLNFWTDNLSILIVIIWFPGAMKTTSRRLLRKLHQIGINLMRDSNQVVYPFSRMVKF